MSLGSTSRSTAAILPSERRAEGSPETRARRLGTLSGGGWLEQALDLHQKLGAFMGYFNSAGEQFQTAGGKQSDLAKMDRAGVRTYVASVGTGSYFQTGPRQFQLAGSDQWLLARLLDGVDAWVARIVDCPRTRLIAGADDLKPDGESIGVIVHITGNNPIMSLDVVDTLFRRGVRAIHPAMQYHNRWCSGYNGMDGPVLTDFGREAIYRMNDLGMVLDTAHASEASAQAIIRASTRPVIDSHTTSTDLVPSSRGHTDETLKMIADSGGVVGVHFADHMLTQEAWRKKYGMMVADGLPKAGYRPRLWAYNQHVLATTEDPVERNRLRKDRAAQGAFFQARGLPPDPAIPKARAATLSDLADVVDYLVGVVGMEHVAIGGDVNGIDDHQWPEGLDHLGELPHLTAELLRRGYDVGTLQKILSANWVRVYKECLPA